MKQVHNIKINVFVKEEDDYDKVFAGLKGLFAFKIDKFLTESVATSFFDKKIKIIEVELKNQKFIKEFISSLVVSLDDKQRRMLVKQVDSRLDQDLNFFIRLDKDKLIDGKYKLTDSGNCYHVKIVVAAFPKNMAAGKKVVEDILSQDI